MPQLHADDTLVEITLTQTVRLRWPEDGRTHSYGPGTVQLPRVLARSLHNLPFSLTRTLPAAPPKPAKVERPARTGGTSRGTERR